MKRFLVNLYVCACFIPCIFHVTLYLINLIIRKGRKSLSSLEEEKKVGASYDMWYLVYLLLKVREFRNVFYWRIGT